MNYGAIRNFDIANGEGVRVTLFVSGCRFACKGCFNLEVQNYQYGQEYSEETASKIIELVSNPVVEGLSLLGGDPLWQDDDGLKQLCELCDRVHELGKNVWLWSGFTIEQVFSDSNKRNMTRALVLKSDVYVDGLFDISLIDKTLNWRGSSNQRVIDMRSTVSTGKLTLVPGIR